MIIFVVPSHQTAAKPCLLTNTVRLCLRPTCICSVVSSLIWVLGFGFTQRV